MNNDSTDKNIRLDKLLDLVVNLDLIVNNSLLSKEPFISVNYYANLYKFMMDGIHRCKDEAMNMDIHRIDYLLVMEKLRQNLNNMSIIFLKEERLLIYRTIEDIKYKILKRSSAYTWYEDTIVIIDRNLSLIDESLFNDIESSISGKKHIWDHNTYMEKIDKINKLRNYWKSKVYNSRYNNTQINRVLVNSGL